MISLRKLKNNIKKTFNDNSSKIYKNNIEIIFYYLLFDYSFNIAFIIRLSSNFIGFWAISFVINIGAI